MKLKYATDQPVLTSWRSEDDPNPGLFSLHVGSLKELIILKDSESYWTSPLISPLADIFSIDGEYITTSSNYSFKFITMKLTGELLLVRYPGHEQASMKLSESIKCGGYGFCGQFSICDETADEPCDCLQGFKSYAAQGCKRNTDLPCSNVAQEVGFLPMSKVYLPNDPLPVPIHPASECETACLGYCNCTGYAYDQEHGCLVWEGPPLNLKQFSKNVTYKTDFSLKLANQDLVAEDPGFMNSKVPRNNQLSNIVVPIASIAAVVTLCLFVYYARRKLIRKGEDLLLLDLGMILKATNSESEDSRKRKVQMSLFNFTSVSAAIDNFSDANKLVEGGFGPVYKA